MAKNIKVLIVDDSALIRKILTEILNSDPMIDVVGTAEDPLFARDKIKALKPDVVTLDIEMPRMDGITFLRNLMRLRPMPVVMISTLTESGANVTLQALEIGAVDFVPKPKVDVIDELEKYRDEIIEKVKIAAIANVRPYSEYQGVKNKATYAGVDKKHSADVILNKKTDSTHLKSTEKIIALGASTGGTEAIKEVLMKLPYDIPGMLITQHIPAAFSEPFSKRMNENCAATVHHAADGQQILPGNVYIAPGNQHLMVEKSGTRYYCKLNDGPLVNRHKPSVDVLFRSVVHAAGPNAIGVILTGMGDDGAKGMKEMHDVGSPCIAQDENSSVVWGMPGAAVKEGGVDHVLPLDKISEKLVELIRKMQ
ncbi:MAG: chemotaxis response regulator protein-glutamate methylesterase [Gammaproteobacteria bacterium]|nr:chemotaxis response regulator protein-glutamate methylesterase [Gammaproteobacteria bacterium]